MQKTISSKQVYQGKIFTMTHDEVLIENGMEVTRDIIHHHGGVGVLLILDHNILLVKQYRYATKQDLLEIPAGKLEEKEDSLVCGKRELEEETGYQCQKMHLFTSFYSTPGFCSEKIYLYEALQPSLVEHPKAMDEDEDIEVVWLPLEEAYQMIQNGQIQDAKTIIAIQYALLKDKNEQ